MLRLCILLVAVTAPTALAAGSKADAKRLAKEHFQRAETYYEAGAYAQAIDEYQVAYKLAPLPGLLFDIAKALRMSGDAAGAVEYYQRYLKEEPSGPGAAEAKTQLAALRLKLDAPPAPEPVRSDVPVASPPIEAPPPPPAAPVAAPAPVTPVLTATPTDDRPGVAWPALAVGAAGVGAGVIGAILVGTSRGDYGRLSASCGPSCDPALSTGPRTRETVGFTLVSVGAAALAGGVLWFLLAP